jgi:hypothetical protein
MTDTCNNEETPTVDKQQTQAPADAPASVQNDTETPKKRRRGAPSGNTNALKTGLRSGKFPPGTEYLIKEITRFKHLCSAAIAEIHGELGFQQVALLQTACEHYSHGLRVRRWLRVGWDDLTADQVIAYSREIGQAFDKRDKVLKQLGIDARPHDEGKRTLYALPQLPDDEPEGQTVPTEPPSQ